MKKLFYFILVLGLALSLGLAGCSDAGKKSIKIGVIGPMSFSQGKGHWNGAVLAMESVNAAGGVKVGKETLPIELVKADSNEFLSITDATNAMEKLVSLDKVDFVVGGFRTEAVLAMQDIAMDSKRIFIGCGAAHPELCTRVTQNYDRYKYWFRGTPFNSSYLVKTNFIHLALVAGALREQLGIAKPKVAIVAEKQVWVEPIIAAAEENIPKMGMEVAGIWRPSQTATDVTAELSGIQRAGAHIIFTVFSASVGIPFAKQVGELKIPAVMVGINVEAQKDGFWEATEGKGNYALTMNTYCQGVEYNELTKPFVESYVARFGETPTYTADTYAAIMNLVRAVEKAGSLDPDMVVAILEKSEDQVPAGRVKYDESHDLVWGPGYLTSLGVQWVDGKQVGVWPHNWNGLNYKGTVPYTIPPYMFEYYKKETNQATDQAAE